MSARDAALRVAPAFAMMVASALGAGYALMAAAAAIGTGAGPLCSAGCLDRRIEGLDALPASSQRVDAARDLVGRQLANSPFDDTGWLRRSLLGRGLDGLNPEGARALAASYRFAPVDVQVARWRTQFTFDNWSSAGPEAQAAALKEVRVLYPRNPAAFEALARSIRDPVGGLVYRFLLIELGSEG